MTVNGVVVTEMGAMADPDTDAICVDGRPVAPRPKPLYVVLNKPTGTVTTVRDRHAEHTVMDLVRGLPTRVFPVGRLDRDTAGLLILTNDGDFAQKLAHPGHGVPKTYRAVVRGAVGPRALSALSRGVDLGDGPAARAEVANVQVDAARNVTALDLTIREGRNRQVRRMMVAVGHPVLALTRTRIGSLRLSGLAPGTWRKLRPREVEALLAESAAGVPTAGPSGPPRTQPAGRGAAADRPTGGARRAQPARAPEKPRSRARPAVSLSDVRREAQELTRKLAGPDARPYRPGDRRRPAAGSAKPPAAREPGAKPPLAPAAPRRNTSGPGPSDKGSDTGAAPRPARRRRRDA